MPRTKQLPRKSTGGRPVRKILAVSDSRMYRRYMAFKGHEVSQVKESDDDGDSNSESEDNASEPEPKKRKMNTKSKPKSTASKLGSDSQDNDVVSREKSEQLRAAAKIARAKASGKFDPHAVSSWLQEVITPATPPASSHGSEHDGSESDHEPSAYGEDSSQGTDNQVGMDAAAQHHNVDTRSSHAQPFGSLSVQARDRMKHTGVHAFNLPVSDLQKMAEANAGRSSGSMAPFTHARPENAEELRQLFISALVSPTSMSKENALASANANLQVAQVALRHAELKERLATLRAQEAAKEVEDAKSAVNHACNKAKEVKDSQDQSDEFEGGEEPDNEARAKHNALMAKIDAKILKNRAQIRHPRRQPQASTDNPKKAEKRKRRAK